MKHLIVLLIAVAFGCSDDSPGETDQRADMGPHPDMSAVGDVFGADSNADQDATIVELPPPQGPSSLEMGVEICPWETLCSESSAASLASCLEYYEDERFAFFVTREQRRSTALALIECLQTATSCSDYRACRDVGTDCTESSCDGDLLNVCSRQGTLITQDCAASGLECLETGEFTDPVLCGIPGATCTGISRCEGDIQLWCPNEGQEVPFAYDCSQYGLVCDQGACVREQATECPTGGGCSGNQLLACLNGVSVPVDCRDLHPELTCVDRRTGEPFLDPLGDPQCLMPEEQTECQGEFGRGLACEGDVAVVCVKNREFRMDCSNVGGICVEEESPFEGLRVACRPE